MQNQRAIYRKVIFLRYWVVFTCTHAYMYCHVCTCYCCLIYTPSTPLNIPSASPQHPLNIPPHPSTSPQHPFNNLSTSPQHTPNIPSSLNIPVNDVTIPSYFKIDAYVPVDALPQLETLAKESDEMIFCKAAPQGPR